MAKGPTLTVTLVTDDKMTPGLRTATGEVEGFGRRVSGFAVGAGAALTTMAVSAIPQVIDLGGQMVGLGQQAELYRTKSKTVFGSSAGDIATWADSVNESFGLSDEAVVGLASGMGDLLVPMGFARDEAARMTKETVGVAGALSAWSGGAYDTAEVSDILTKAMLGEREQLKALGISINQAEVDQRALEIAQKDGRDSITEQDKALATQQLIFEKSADAQAAWADGSMDAVKSQNEMKASLEDVKTSIGTALLPMVQKATAWIVDEFIPGVRELVDVFKEKWPEIQAAVEPVITWFRDTIADVVTVVSALWEKFGETILGYVTSTWENIRAVIEGVIMVIKGIIDTVLGILTGDWAKAWDGIRAIVEGVWGIIGGIVDQALNLVKTSIGLAWDGVKALTSVAWDGVKTVVSNAIGAVVGFVVGIPGRISATVSGLWEGLKTGITTAKDWIGERIDDIVDFVTGIPGRVAKAVGDGFKAIPDAFKSAINGIVRAWNGLSFRIKGGPWDPLGSFGPEIPAVNFGFDTPDIPEIRHGGGIAGGRSFAGLANDEVAAILRRGETILTPGQTAAAVAGGDTYNFYGVRDGRSVRREMEMMAWEKGSR